MDLSRRDTIKMLGATAFVPALGALPANAALPPNLSELRARAQAVIDSITQQELDHILTGPASQYTQIFKHTDMRVEPTQATVVQPVQVAHVRFNLQTGALDKRFIYQFTPQDCALGFHVSPADSDHNIRAFTLSLAKALKEYREIEAAKIFNTARTYDPSVGGDGCPLLSVWHPRDEGVWANTFGSRVIDEAIAPALTVESLTEVLHRIQDGTVDEANLKLNAWGQKLVVPVALMDVAERVMRAMDFDQFPRCSKEHLVYDYLENEKAWFVLTNMSGLTWWEHQPFQLTVEVDEAGTVAIVATEKRCFGCHDPRAVFGSFPA